MVVFLALGIVLRAYADNVPMSPYNDSALHGDGDIRNDPNPFAGHRDDYFTGNHRDHPYLRRRRLDCRCINKNYPCWTGTACNSANQDWCENQMGGSYCVHQPCADPQCETCTPDGQTCRACKDGHVADADGACVAEAQFFGDVAASLLPGGVVALASPTLHAALARGYAGTHDRGAAARLAAHAFARLFEDRFALVVVLPSAPLPGSRTHQEYNGVAGLGGTTALEGVITARQDFLQSRTFVD